MANAARRWATALPQQSRDFATPVIEAVTERATVLLLPNTSGRFREEVRRQLASDTPLWSQVRPLVGPHLTVGDPRLVPVSAQGAAVIHRDPLTVLDAAENWSAQHRALFIRADEPYLFLRCAVAAESLSTVAVPFAVPFPAAGHAHRRLVTRTFLNICHEKLCEGGILLAATDHEGLHRFHHQQLALSKLAVDWRVTTGRVPEPWARDPRPPDHVLHLTKGDVTPAVVVEGNGSYDYHRAKHGALE